MELAFGRLAALRSVLAAGVIAASFIIQPAIAQSPAPLSKSCRQGLSAIYGGYAAKYAKVREHLNSIKESQYRKLCDYGRRSHPIFLQELAALDEMRRAGCWNELAARTYASYVRLEKSDRDTVDEVCRKAAAQERQQGRSR